MLACWRQFELRCWLIGIRARESWRGQTDGCAAARGVRIGARVNDSLDDPISKETTLKLRVVPYSRVKHLLASLIILWNMQDITNSGFHLRMQSCCLRPNLEERRCNARRRSRHAQILLHSSSLFKSITCSF